MDTSRNFEVLQDFCKYCNEHKDERFWQALRNWSGYAYILGLGNVEDGKINVMPEIDYNYLDLIAAKDTFYFENKND